MDFHYTFSFRVMVDVRRRIVNVLKTMALEQTSQPVSDNLPYVMEEAGMKGSSLSFLTVMLKSLVKSMEGV